VWYSSKLMNLRHGESRILRNTPYRPPSIILHLNTSMVTGFGFWVYLQLGGADVGKLSTSGPHRATGLVTSGVHPSPWKTPRLRVRRASSGCSGCSDEPVSEIRFCLSPNAKAWIGGPHTVGQSAGRSSRSRASRSPLWLAMPKT